MIYLILSGAAALLILVSIILERRAKDTEGRRDDVLVPLARNFLLAGLAVASGLILLQDMGVDLMAPLAGLGAGGLMVALALQPMAKDFMAAVMLFVKHPFSPGHYVKIAGHEGIVDDITFSTTVLRTDRDERIFIPNGQVMGGVIVNCSVMKWRTLSLDYTIAPTVGV
ncbi:MAG: mechanosensitive ion channel, partial [Gemmatimonadota bacterium]|nr:mechanosensitive ion channel [Gemmatimonadota bacterium]